MTQILSKKKKTTSYFPFVQLDAFCIHYQVSLVKPNEIEEREVEHLILLRDYCAFHSIHQEVTKAHHTGVYLLMGVNTYKKIGNKVYNCKLFTIQYC